MIPSTFAALQHHQFRLLWLGLATSSVGEGIQQFALGYYVVQIAVREGRSELAPFYVGLLGVARLVPALTFGLFAGVIADRTDRRTILVVSRCSSALIAATLSVLVLTDNAGIGAVMALMSLSALTNSLDSPTRQAVVPRVVPAQDLVSAQGMFNSTFTASQILGPLIGGIAIAPVGIGGLMLMQAGTSLVSAAALLGLPRLAPIALHKNGMLSALREGLMTVAQDPVVRWVMIMSLVVGIFGRPVNQLMPAIANNALHVGAVELSWLLSVSGLGSLAGTIFAASLGGVARRGLVVTGAMLCWGLLLVVFSAQHTLVGALLVVWMPNIAWFTFSGMALVLCQTRTPDQLRARVISVYILTASIGGAVGSFVLGTIGSLIGVNWSVTIAGVTVATVGAFVLLRVRSVREVGLPSEVRSALA